MRAKLPLFTGFDPAEEGPTKLCRTIDFPGDVIMLDSAGDLALQF